MVERAKEPSKGKWGLPGGFIDARESAEAALKRECKEEIGVEITSSSYLCSYPNAYHYGGLTYHTLDLYFMVELAPGSTPKALDEVASTRWFVLEKIDMEQVAFPSCQKAIKSLQLTVIQR